MSTSRIHHSRIEKKFGHATAVRLFDHAPRAILAGELPD
jgi:hypothetical protein